MAKALVGLDIGSFAVRAVELRVDTKGGRELRHFGQVTLPVGAVVDGEVVDGPAVVSALRRLWAEGQFSTRKVVLGVSGQRVLVRQADMTPMSDDDLRTAIRYEAQELIPMPIDSVFLDSQIMEQPAALPGPVEAPSMRILLAAAARSVVSGCVAACHEASLEPIAVDVVALALLRAVPAPPHTDDGDATLDAVVSIGADLTVVAIRENAITRFVRVLTTGGSDLTEAVARGLTVDGDTAEDLKRQAVGEGHGGAVAVLSQARQALLDRIDPLVDEICGTIDFFRAQARVGAISRVLVTGGATMTASLVPRLSDALGIDVGIVDPYQWLTAKGHGLTSAELLRAGPYLTTPVGLALWAAPRSDRQISLLPSATEDERRHRRGIALGAATVVVAAGALGGLWSVQHRQFAHAQTQASVAKATAASLQSQVTAFAADLRLEHHVQQLQGQAVAGLSSDTDWIRLMGQIAAVMPADVSISSFSSSDALSTQAGLASTKTISISATAADGAPSVASWIRALDRIPALSDIWVANVSSGTGTKSINKVTFSSTATVTGVAGSNRAVQFSGNGK